MKIILCNVRSIYSRTLEKGAGFFVSEQIRVDRGVKIYQGLTTGRIYFNGWFERIFVLIKFEYITSTRGHEIKKAFNRKAENP